MTSDLKAKLIGPQYPKKKKNQSATGEGTITIPKTSNKTLTFNVEAKAISQPEYRRQIPKRINRWSYSANIIRLEKGLNRQQPKIGKS